MEAGGMSRIIRCLACAKRIRPAHAHVGVVDLETGAEWSYHARPRCMERASQETAARLVRGKVYVLRHYHVCDDETAGFACRGGCFSEAPLGAA